MCQQQRINQESKFVSAAHAEQYVKRLAAATIPSAAGLLSLARCSVYWFRTNDAMYASHGDELLWTS